ncbi:MAG: arsenic efflux protein [Clostridia bacterium]|nr:arsenic efflux protein [Clostridia bacterium]
MWDTISDAFLDTLKIFPFLLIIYILIELLEHKTSFTGDRERLQGNLAPLAGAATGLIPQCGFSVMAAKLYDSGLIRTGTLLAVFIATSDEAFIILLSDGMASALLPLIVVKIVVAVIVGYGANLLLAKEKVTVAPLNGSEISCYSCGREHDGKSDLHLYLIDPLIHSLKISLYILIVNLVLGCIIDAIGEDEIASLLIGGIYFQPFISAAIGLIPNCASSVIITETYIGGFMTFGSCAAGLCANAGLGFVVLFKNKAKFKRNLILIAVIYIVSVVTGIVINCAQSLITSC